MLHFQLACMVRVESHSKRKRLNSADKRHRRTRSGDDKAATLMTGKSAWAGMELHKLPLPHEREDDDDDTFDSSKNPLEGNEHVTTSKSSSTNNMDGRKTRRRSRRNSPVSEQNFSHFPG